MQTEYLIAIDEFCSNHQIEFSFIQSLQQNGLIEIITIKESSFIDAKYLPHLEKMVRLYYELNINLEGIDTITHMLQRIIMLQDEVVRLRNRLRLYESDDKTLSFQ